MSRGAPASVADRQRRAFENLVKQMEGAGMKNRLLLGIVLLGSLGLSSGCLGRYGAR